MQYRLRTLLIASGIGPPVIAFLWHDLWLILMFVAVATLFAVWYLIAWVLARSVGEFVGSLMG